jgi:hypothetical protein
LEYTFAGKNKPFVSLAFRSGGEPGWEEGLGIRNGAVSITMGAIASFGKNVEEQPPEEDETSPFAD